jgi:hypothetical protein
LSVTRLRHLLRRLICCADLKSRLVRNVWATSLSRLRSEAHDGTCDRSSADATPNTTAFVARPNHLAPFEQHPVRSSVTVVSHEVSRQASSELVSPWLSALHRLASIDSTSLGDRRLRDLTTFHPPLSISGRLSCWNRNLANRTPGYKPCRHSSCRYPHSHRVGRCSPRSPRPLGHRHHCHLLVGATIHHGHHG